MSNFNFITFASFKLLLRLKIFKQIKSINVFLRLIYFLLKRLSIILISWTNIIAILTRKLKLYHNFIINF